ncbi:hypothetical protein JOD54_000294 [Actinokineospora baliensis]|uniref:hypothetical protein n=1 Tax=Actinokineospora baliensis TaxID=547056 RepID=UPI00195E9D11|nr:hypothetical protein [Actinokineospora baliensis]MBM7770090.1 hypothetical protein [Actinokineospora baliensis]
MNIWVKVDSEVSHVIHGHDDVYLRFGDQLDLVLTQRGLGQLIEAASAAATELAV